jgi:hypothetical protein
MLALRVYEAIKPQLDQIVEEGPFLRPLTSASPVAEASGLPDALSFPPVQVPEHPETVNHPLAEGIQAAAPDVPRAHTRRTMRSAQIHPNLAAKKSLASLPPTPASLEAGLQASKSRKTRSGGVKKTGLKHTFIQPQSAPTVQTVPPVPSPALGEDSKAPQPPKVSGGAKRTGGKPKAYNVPPLETVQETQPALPATPAAPQLQEAKGAAKTKRTPNAFQVHSNGIMGTGVAGPSNSASEAEPLYPPALAQRIWDMAEAGKYHAAHSLFPSQERFERIVGEDEVRKYLLDHPDAGEKLKPLANGGTRKELFLCRSRTFWVPQGEKKEGPREFVLEHRTTDCPVGYATDHNLYKHVYKFHLKKEYGNYPKKGSAAQEQKKPAKGKGKARQTQKKPTAPKKDEDDYADEGNEDHED